MRFCDRGGTTTTGTTTTKRAAPTSEEMKAAHAEDHAVECSCQSTANRDFAEGSRLAGPEPSAHTDCPCSRMVPTVLRVEEGESNPPAVCSAFRINHGIGDPRFIHRRGCTSAAGYHARRSYSDS